MALMTVGQTISQMLPSTGLPLLPTRETWFACGEGKIEIDQCQRARCLYFPEHGWRTRRQCQSTDMCCMGEARRSPSSVHHSRNALLSRRKAGQKEGSDSRGNRAGLFARMLQRGADRVVTVKFGQLDRWNVQSITGSP